MAGALQTSGKMVDWFSPSPCHMSESALDYFPEHGRVEPLLGKQVGPPELSLGLLESRSVFPCLFPEGEVPVWFPGKYGMAMP